MRDVANIIRQQIGVPSFMEVGATKLKGYSDALTFEIRTESRRIRTVSVQLMPSDTYTIKSWNKKGDLRVIEDVYAEQLAETIRSLIKKES